MNESNDHIPTTAETEARVVAYVLGEGSAVERAEVERLLVDRPGLAELKREIESVDRLLNESVADEALLEDDDWRLSAERRAAVLEVLEGAPSPASLRLVGEEDAEDRGTSWRLAPLRLTKVAAVLCLLAGAGYMALPQGLRTKIASPTLLATQVYDDEAPAEAMPSSMPSSMSSSRPSSGLSLPSPYYLYDDARRLAQDGYGVATRSSSGSFATAASDLKQAEPALRELRENLRSSGVDLAGVEPPPAAPCKRERPRGPTGGGYQPSWRERPDAPRPDAPKPDAPESKATSASDKDRNSPTLRYDDGHNRRFDWSTESSSLAGENESGWGGAGGGAVALGDGRDEDISRRRAGLDGQRFRGRESERVPGGRAVAGQPRQPVPKRPMPGMPTPALVPTEGLAGLDRRVDRIAETESLPGGVQRSKEAVRSFELRRQGEWRFGAATEKSRRGPRGVALGDGEAQQAPPAAGESEATVPGKPLVAGDLFGDAPVIDPGYAGRRFAVPLLEAKPAEDAPATPTPRIRRQVTPETAPRDIDLTDQRPEVSEASTAPAEPAEPTDALTTPIPVPEDELMPKGRATPQLADTLNDLEAERGVAIGQTTNELIGEQEEYRRYLGRRDESESKDPVARGLQNMNRFRVLGGQDGRTADRALEEQALNGYWRRERHDHDGDGLLDDEAGKQVAQQMAQLDSGARYSSDLDAPFRQGSFGVATLGLRMLLESEASKALDEKLAKDEAFSTFSLNVSDVSFQLAQAALAAGKYPDAQQVRVEEFVNGLDYQDPAPSCDEKVACLVEQAAHPFLQQRNVMRVSMRTAAAGRSSQTPLRLTLLLDNSGSMERSDRRQSVQQAFSTLAGQLAPRDQVTLISFARQPRLLADKVGGAEAAQLVELASGVPSEGGTNIEAALQLAFEKAQEQYLTGAQNRVILLTDGAVNLGDADPGSLAQRIVAMRSSGIAFDAAGVCADGLNDEVLEALTRNGDGRYYLLDRPEQADARFTQQLAGALRPSARNVKVQVEFNPDRIGRYKLLGFEKHRLKKEDFRNDAVDAAEMAAAEAGVALYQFEARPDGEGDVGAVSVRFFDTDSGEVVENRWPIPYEPSAARLEQAAPSLQLATAAGLLASKLRGDSLGSLVDLKTLSRLVDDLPEQFLGDGRVQQLQTMIRQARQISGE
ncbi:MAG: von Willebrand factor type A domain-containing protein [Planctomycetota bacterium]